MHCAALTWTAEIFSMCLLGRLFCMETDHKSLGSTSSKYVQELGCVASLSPSANIISVLKAIFSRHEIPDTVVTDNGIILMLPKNSVGLQNLTTTNMQ